RDDDLRTLLAQPDGERFAQALRGSRDDGNFSFQAFHKKQTSFPINCVIRMYRNGASSAPADAATARTTAAGTAAYPASKATGTATARAAAKAAGTASAYPTAEPAHARRTRRAGRWARTRARAR